MGDGGEERGSTFKKMNVKVFYTFDYKLCPSLQLICEFTDQQVKSERQRERFFPLIVAQVQWVCWLGQ